MNKKSLCLCVTRVDKVLQFVVVDARKAQKHKHSIDHWNYFVTVLVHTKKNYEQIWQNILSISYNNVYY